MRLKDYTRIIDFVESKSKGIFMGIGSYSRVFRDEARKRGWEVLGIEPLEIPVDYFENIGHNGYS